MRANITQSGNDYIVVEFLLDNCQIRTDLLDKYEAFILSKQLRDIAESVEHYSRVIDDRYSQ